MATIIPMTVADQHLINIAETKHWSEWSEVDAMIDKAQSQEAKKRLREIRSYLYHREEAACGNL